MDREAGRGIARTHTALKYHSPPNEVFIYLSTSKGAMESGKSGKLALKQTKGLQNYGLQRHLTQSVTLGSAQGRLTQGILFCSDNQSVYLSPAATRYTLPPVTVIDGQFIGFAT